MKFKSEGYDQEAEIRFDADNSYLELDKGEEVEVTLEGIIGEELEEELKSLVENGHTVDRIFEILESKGVNIAW